MYAPTNLCTHVGWIGVAVRWMPLSVGEMRRSSSMALILMDFARDRGLDERRCLENTRLDRRMLDSPAAEILEEQELLLVRNIVRHLGSAGGLGLAAVRRVHGTAYGVLGRGLLSRAVVRAALSLAAGNAW